MSNWNPQKYLDQSKEIERLRAENERLRAKNEALKAAFLACADLVEPALKEAGDE